MTSMDPATADTIDADAVTEDDGAETDARDSDTQAGAGTVTGTGMNPVGGLAGDGPLTGGMAGQGVTSGNSTLDPAATRE